jgi:hypothetical protein
VSTCARTKKACHPTYAFALDALTRVDKRGTGSVYFCSACQAYHISSRLFTVDRKKGRGKSRKKLVS